MANAVVHTYAGLRLTAASHSDVEPPVGIGLVLLAGAPGWGAAAASVRLVQASRDGAPSEQGPSTLSPVADPSDRALRRPAEPRATIPDARVPREPSDRRSPPGAGAGDGRTRDVRPPSQGDMVGEESGLRVSSTVRLAGDLGFETYVVADATAAFGMEAWDGRHFSAEDVHAAALVNLQGEFATVVSTDDALAAVASAAGG